MPELPEVQTVVNTLRPRIVGRTFLSIPRLRQDIVTPNDFDLTRALVGRVVASLARRGKRICFTLDDGNRFYIHLGMTGRLTIELADADILPHSHLIAHLSGASRETLRFRDPRRFGGIWWLGSESFAGDMGPEPLAMRPAQLLRQLAGTSRAIKNVLLDQTVVAGIGNIYADEALFLSAIHPLTPASALSVGQVHRLNRAIKLTLRRALRHRGSTLRDYVDADGVKGGYQKRLSVYDRASEPCRRCKTPIERMVLTGRSAHFCPNCQKKVRDNEQRATNKEQ
jgi:formamidopyrimidine-DNA glycosylase